MEVHFRKILIHFFSLFVFLCAKNIQAQTNPAAQQIPYTQDFGNTYFNTWPAGFNGWRISPAATTRPNAASSSANANESLFDTATIVKAAGNMFGYSGTAAGNVPLNDGKVYIQTSSSFSQGTDQLVLAVNTSGYTNIKISYDVEMINPQSKPAGIVLQYRIGTSGSWTVIDSTYWYSCNNRVQGQMDYFSNLALGASADNHSVVQIRWATARSNSSAGGSCGSGSCGFGIDNIIVNGDLATPLYYRSLQSGAWNNPNTWETSANNITWSTASTTPNVGDRAITIRSPHEVYTNLNNLVIDEVTILSGARLINSSNTALGIADGSGTDLAVYGTFVDSSNTSVVWTNTASWLLSSNANFIKCTNTNSTNWQLRFETGIANIPTNSNWICRKYSGALYEPAISSTNGGGSNPQATYGNLYIENFSSTWNSSALCKFSGSVNYPVIKGNFYVGGNGSGNVSFLNLNTHSNAVRILGSVFVKSGSTLKSEGTGIEVRGDITCDGEIIYSLKSPSTTKIQLTGTGNQTISGVGNVYTGIFQVNKSSGLVNVQSFTRVDHSLTLTNGIVVTDNNVYLNVNTNATLSGGSNNSYVRGPLRKYGNASFGFPIGKTSLIRPLGVSTSTATTPFWTEAFENGCASGCLASGFNGVNGVWSESTIGYNGTLSNQWFVSSAECGNNSGNCSSTCGGDASLHVGKNNGSVTDEWATYDGTTFDVTTNRRIESPTINCSGKSNILLSFNYLENGDAADNAMLWYFNGSEWVLLADLAKTTKCSSARGFWNNFVMYAPPSFDNNPNIKLAFTWSNNNDGVTQNVSFAVDDISLSSITQAYVAEYFENNPQIDFGTAIDPTLHHISMCEYWILQKENSNASKNITLSWASNSCGVSNLSEMRVARWDTSLWRNVGNTGTIGSFSLGAVTGNSISEVGAFTLASITSNNPLPISLLQFNGQYNGRVVNLYWTTATELNNDYFTIEKSVDGEYFSELLRKPGAGNSTTVLNYNAQDEHPFNGINYYRLKQTDFDGTSTNSNIVAVRINSGLFEIISVKSEYDDRKIDALISFSTQGKALIEIVSMTGNVLAGQTINTNEGSQNIPFSAQNLSHGIYILRVTQNGESIQKKFVY